MKRHVMLTIMALLRILLTSFHLAHDVVLGWVWTLLALGATAIVSVVLSAGGLWSLGRSQSSRRRA